MIQARPTPRASALARWVLSALVVATAVAMLLVIAIPGTVWRQATTGTEYPGFDPNLLSLNPGNYQASSEGTILVSPATIQISAAAGSTPSVHLLTTASSSFKVTMKVAIQSNPIGSTPLRVGLWSPRSNSGYFLVFGPEPENAISSESVVDGIPDQTLVGGTIDRVVQGRYTPAQSYDLQVTVAKDSGLLAYDLSGPGLASLHVAATPSNPAGLINELRLTLTASVASTSVTSNAMLSDYSLSVPAQTGGALRVDDPLATTLLVLLGIVGGFLVAISGISWARRIGQTGVAWPVLRIGRTHLIVGGAVVLVVAGLNALLFGLGTATFDMKDQETWSYIAATYGPAQVFLLAPFTTVAQAWNGVPYAAADFPYQPVMVYFFALFGWIGRLFGSFEIQNLIKAVNVAFGLLDGLLILSIMRALNFSWRWSVTASALWVFNPAVWFSMSIWGADHVLSLFFILLAILLAEHDHPVGAWLALGIGSLTRPQMLVLGVLVGVLLLRKFPLRTNVMALSWTVIAIFLSLIPFTIATSPSLPVDLMTEVFRVQALGGNEKVLTTVSLDVYSFWPLVTLLVSHQSGLARILFPSDSPLFGSVTYHQVGLLVALVIVVGAVVLLATRSKAKLLAGGYLPIVAFGFAGFLMFTPGLAATHFVLALPFILLCAPWLRVTSYIAMVAGWTITTLLAMYGILAVDLANSDWLHVPLFGQHQSLSALSSFVAQVYTSDRTISVGVVINTMIFVALMFTAVRNRQQAANG